MALLILISTMFVSTFTFAEIRPIEDFNLSYYRMAFLDAYYFEALPIEDPISTPATNKELLKIYNDRYQFIGYIREVSTDVGCDSFCKPLDFTLAMDPKATFLKLLVYEPLTKLGHAEFSQADYLKLHEILTTPPTSYQTILQPDDMIDALTGATKLELVNDVVGTAAYTCFRIHLYKQQTLTSITQNFLKEFL